MSYFGGWILVIFGNHSATLFFIILSCFQVLSQSDEHSGQIARLTTELEQSHKKNSEMKREINERKVLSNQLQEIEILSQRFGISGGF